MARKKADAAPLTTAQRLGALIKSARDIMRKDKGLNGDLDRLPLFTWIMFLKFLDDSEMAREQKAVLAGKKYRPAVEPPYRWRDWAAKEDGISGPELLAFVNQEKAVRPDGAEGPGLLPYLRVLQGNNGDDRRDVIASVFSGVVNRMESGYLLRDIVNKVNGIHFNAHEEIHTLGHLYESMLKEMRDAAGDSGEFYTPRAVVRFLVEAVNPRLGETVLDPACGTGGFLVEAYAHLEKQCRTVQDRQTLQTRSVLGGEAKPLPYMLAQMNLLLHGLEVAARREGQQPRREGRRDRRQGSRGRDPDQPAVRRRRGARHSRQLPRRQAHRRNRVAVLAAHHAEAAPVDPRRFPAGRAAVVVPNGTLFGDGVCAKIKEELLTQFNLHTIVRLPNGVFTPYTPIATNLLFFDRGGPTREVWYYEQSLSEGRKQYTKTQPLAFEEFADCLAWWPKRQENDRAWKVPAADLLAAGCNLDRKNPHAKANIEHLPPRSWSKASWRRSGGSRRSWAKSRNCWRGRDDE